MVNQYAFFFDASACTGCKACQVACKDRNNLEAGLLWRRVYEVAGGSWEKRGEVWVPAVVAYNVSMACNHCEKPVCAMSCPVKAIGKRDDGIVLIDTARCIGCRYCEWACPYNAIRFDPMAEAVNYALNQWDELNVFCSDGAVPIDNNVSEREMKRIILNRRRDSTIAG